MVLVFRACMPDTQMAIRPMIRILFTEVDMNAKEKNYKG
jgi:hypothetical protein